MSDERGPTPAHEEDPPPDDPYGVDGEPRTGRVPHVRAEQPAPGLNDAFAPAVHAQGASAARWPHLAGVGAAGAPFVVTPPFGRL